jgi:hypothetical protein
MDFIFISREVKVFGAISANTSNQEVTARGSGTRADRALL